MSPDVFGTRALATIVSIMTALMFFASGTFTCLASLDYDLALVFTCGMGALACLVYAPIRLPSQTPQPLAEVALG